MAFVCSIASDTYRADTIRNGNAYLSVINVGYDDQENVSYSLVVGLEPLAGGDYEFFFHLVAANGDDGSEHPYWSARDVATFIGREDRARIRAVLLTATHSLVETARPDRVECVTYDENPPDRALVKYFLIAEVFRGCGYAVTSPDPWHGKHIWWMERRPQPYVASTAGGAYGGASEEKSDEPGSADRADENS